MNKYKVGDRVLIKKWDDIVEEFGMYKDYYINTKPLFVSKKYCNKLYKIIDIYHNDYYNENYYVLENIYNYTFSDDMIERKIIKINMTKSDLKSGMIVETRDGERYITIIKKNRNPHFMNLNNSNTCYSYSDYHFLNNLSLSNTYSNSNLDIVKIYEMEDTLKKCVTAKCLIWERKEKKK